MIDSRDAFLHNYSQLALMLNEYSGVMTAVNTMSLKYLSENKAVLLAVVDSAYYTHRALHSLVEVLSAAGDENATDGLTRSKETADTVERRWKKARGILSGSVPDLNHPLLALDFIVKEPSDGG